mmetsp:Transcript_26532/g.66762  ORF Transcript_26532/g.66762 Transcript_26532/m.66762 type:complete len:81 (+) Transcript_26532:563-805(+)
MASAEGVDSVDGDGCGTSATTGVGAFDGGEAARAAGRGGARAINGAEVLETTELDLDTQSRLTIDLSHISLELFRRRETS